MKKIIFIVGILISINSYSQLSGEISFNAGLALPMGDLPKEEWLNAESGFAETGYNFGVDITGFYKDTFGIGFSFENYYFFVDEEPMLEQAFEPGIDSTLEISSDDWRISYNSFMFKYRYHFNSKINIDFYGKIGWMQNRAPQILIKATDVNGKKTVLQRDAENATNMAYGFGIQLNYNFRENYGFNLKSNINLANASYDYRNGDVKVNRRLYGFGLNGGLFFLF